MLRRRQGFEFGDQAWVRGWLREAYLEGLNLATRLGGQYRRAPAVFRAWARAAGAAEVLDLGSGGGGPVAQLLAAAERDAQPLPRVVLSDVHPQVALFRRWQARFGAARLGFRPEPVPADAVPADAPGARCLIAVFHHFAPDLARRVVADALRRGGSLFILEPFQRDARHFLFALLAGPWAYLPAPFAGGRIAWRAVPFMLLLPLAPLMLWWDACASVLRTYRPEEIAAMIPAESHDRVAWEAGALAYGPGLRATFVRIAPRSGVVDAQNLGPLRS